jgi:hypothetical protein
MALDELDQFIENLRVRVRVLEQSVARAEELCGALIALNKDCGRSLKQFHKLQGLHAIKQRELKDALESRADAGVNIQLRREVLLALRSKHRGDRTVPSEGAAARVARHRAVRKRQLSRIEYESTPRPVTVSLAKHILKSRSAELLLRLREALASRRMSLARRIIKELELLNG